MIGTDYYSRQEISQIQRDLDSTRIVKDMGSRVSLPIDRPSTRPPQSRIGTDLETLAVLILDKVFLNILTSSIALLNWNEGISDLW